MDFSCGIQFSLIVWQALQQLARGGGLAVKFGDEEDQCCGINQQTPLPRFRKPCWPPGVVTSTLSPCFLPISARASGAVIEI